VDNGSALDADVFYKEDHDAWTQHQEDCQPVSAFTHPVTPSSHNMFRAVYQMTNEAQQTADFKMDDYVILLFIPVDSQQTHHLKPYSI